MAAASTTMASSSRTGAKGSACPPSAPAAWAAPVASNARTALDSQTARRPPITRSVRGRRDVGGARGARHEFLGNGLAGVREGLANRRHVGTKDGFPLVPAPLIGSGHGVERALEPRHHIAREELVALERLFPTRPLVGAEEQSAEAPAREVCQPLDTLAHGVGRAHERGAGGHALADRIVRPPGWPSQGDRK